MNTGNGSQPTFFVLEEDDDTRGPLVANLRRDGYRVVVAIDEEDALERVGGGRVQADLVLIDLVGKTADEGLGVGRRIRRHAEHDGHTPLVVMAEKYGKEVEGTEENVAGNDWVFYLGEEPGQLKDFLARLTREV